MKTFYKKILSCVLILLASILLLSSNASAEIVPYPPDLTLGGNYTYDVGTHILTLDLIVFDVTYSNGDPGSDDPILNATFSFGTLMNSGDPNNLIFGPSPGGSTGPVSFSINDFITATLDNFVVQINEQNGYNSILEWGNLYNIQPVEGAPSSRYVDELLANGGGSGYMMMSFTPEAGGTEYFTSNSFGSVGGQIAAAPEPVSAILFITGGATLAFRRYLKKRI